jgi:hypothetical protein
LTKKELQLTFSAPWCPLSGPDEIYSGHLEGVSILEDFNRGIEVRDLPAAACRPGPSSAERGDS